MFHFQNKFKQIEPIDYDSYIEQNIVNLRKDACTKQLSLLPHDDVYAESDIDADENGTKLKETRSLSNTSPPLPDPVPAPAPPIGQELSLFVNDCLKMYSNKRFEIKYKYHLYGGNYRQLPCFDQHSSLLQSDRY